MYLEIATDRLLLRPIKVGDADFFMALVNSKGWLQFIGDRNISTRNASKCFIKTVLDKENHFYHVIELKDTVQPIGIVTFLKKENENYPDLGFALLPEHEKNGYALEACKAYLDVVKNSKIHEQIIAIAMAENHKSIRLLKKLGFEYLDNFSKDNEVLSHYVLKKDATTFLVDE